MPPKAPTSRPPEPPPSSTTPPNPPGPEETLPWLEEMPPKKIVAELDRYIVGQEAAKKAVAIAVRNRWRRSQAPEEIRDEIMPNNIIMIGPTGVGKTEIARRLARLAGAPFLKVEASKFTEVGYVGRDVESMVRELVDVAINMVRTDREAAVRRVIQGRRDPRRLRGRRRDPGARPPHPREAAPAAQGGEARGARGRGRGRGGAEEARRQGRRRELVVRPRGEPRRDIHRRDRQDRGRAGHRRGGRVARR